MNAFKQFLAAALLSSFSCCAALADIIDFNLIDPDSRDGVYNSTYAMEYNYLESGLGLSVTGWSYGQTCTSYYRRSCSAYAVNNRIEQDYVGAWTGLGVEMTSTPNHAIDNENNDYDMLLLSFDQLVTLTSLDLGWISNDSDLSLLAFGGSSFNSASLLGKKWEDLLTMDWYSVGNYYNLDSAPNSGIVNTAGYTAQYWLVGAYNANLGGLWDGNNINNTTGNDYFKLSGVTVDRPSTRVPEPSALLMLIFGLVGLGALRRKAR